MDVAERPLGPGVPYEIGSLFGWTILGARQQEVFPTNNVTVVLGTRREASKMPNTPESSYLALCATWTPFAHNCSLVLAFGILAEACPMWLLAFLF